MRTMQDYRDPDRRRATALAWYDRRAVADPSAAAQVDRDEFASEYAENVTDLDKAWRTARGKRRVREAQIRKKRRHRSKAS